MKCQSIWLLFKNEIKNNAWVTMNNDFWSRVRSFVIDFDEWRLEIGKSPHEWPKKSLFTLTNVLFYFLHYFMSWTHHFSTNNNRSLISPLSLRMVFSDLTLWRWHCHVNIVTRTRGTGIVTSYSPIVTARAYRRNGDLHYWITTVNMISHHPVFTA